MKSRFAFVYLKRNFNDGVQTLGFLRMVIARRVKAQTINPRTKTIVFGQQLDASAIPVCARGAQHNPIACAFASFETYRYVLCWLALGHIQNMR